MTLTSEELENILESHKKWVHCIDGGERADLSGAVLNGADFHNTLLMDANLQMTNCREADFSFANLKGANLMCADLGGADLSGANLTEADLRLADLRWADLTGVNFTGADLRGANLGGLHLRDVTFKDAKGLDLACPSDGEFIAWKKAEGRLVKLLIPSDAKRSSATSNKCRSDKAVVLGIYTLEGEETQETSVKSGFDPTFVYTVGETVYPDSFDDDRFNECSHGIHFFIDRAVAARY